ncbi:uncharacterized protein EV420DRAFT_1476150 [Desarmillaria tabescens]|uniref:Uncharacterized protein n=1 Tax=Armillaria tabescens TaxID=1929756 RepID=A0AA39U0T7_ARMTA|nr:uncharacterized protein EV420DRAFT_1476150 [Desarmillaria tabescens]KAK0464760.1 hypothetical protein EV420DRAFT_1476150 [Desarmillaria tabescens]
MSQRSTSDQTVSSMWEVEVMRKVVEEALSPLQTSTLETQYSWKDTGQTIQDPGMRRTRETMEVQAGTALQMEGTSPSLPRDRDWLERLEQMLQDKKQQETWRTSQMVFGLPPQPLQTIFQSSPTSESQYQEPRPVPLEAPYPGTLEGEPAESSDSTLHHALLYCIQELENLASVGMTIHSLIPKFKPLLVGHHTGPLPVEKTNVMPQPLLMLETYSEEQWGSEDPDDDPETKHLPQMGDVTLTPQSKSFFAGFSSQVVPPTGTKSLSGLKETNPFKTRSIKALSHQSSIQHILANPTVGTPSVDDFGKSPEIELGPYWSSSPISLSTMSASSIKEITLTDWTSGSELYSKPNKPAKETMTTSHPLMRGQASLSRDPALGLMTEEIYNLNWNQM